MSISCYGVVEMLWGHSPKGTWFTAAELMFYGDVQCMSVLAHPWGRWTKADDNLKPIVAPRKLPKDLGFQAKHRIEDVCPISELRCATWLTREEVAKASVIYQGTHSKGLKCAEIEAALGVMAAHEDGGRDTTTRLVLWFR